MALTPEHEALHRIFAEDENGLMLASALRRILKVEIPAPANLEPLNVDFTEFKKVVERRSDTVLKVMSRTGNPQDDFILLVESQTEDDRSRRTVWPYYIAYLQTKYRLPVLMLVVCSKAATARWARKAIKTGLPGLTCQVTTPIVLGPDNVPALTSVAEAAENLHFAVYSALTHSREPEARVILEALEAALETTDPDTASDLSDFIEDGLGDTPGYHIWRELMATRTPTYVSETRAKSRAEGRVEGRVEGEAKAILRVLARRGFTVEDADRERIESCGDLETLEKWLDRSVDADRVEDLFKD